MELTGVSEDEDTAPRLSEPEDRVPGQWRGLLEAVRGAREAAGALRPDQLAFSQLAEDLLLGDTQRDPMACCRVLEASEIPGGGLSPFQAQSLQDFADLRTPPLPTHEAVRRFCKSQLVRLQSAARDPEAARLHTEYLSARPHANDAEGMALAAQKDGGHPLGGKPTAPMAFIPRLQAVGDQLPMVDTEQLRLCHAKHCGACKEVRHCWINTAARIISSADLLSEEGFATAALQREPLEPPPEINEVLISKVERLLAQDAVHEAQPGTVDNYSTIFLAATGRDAALDASLLAVLEGGGEAASRAAARCAAGLAEKLATDYLAGAAAGQRPAWEEAEAKLFVGGKQRVVIDLSPLSPYAPQLRMRYPELYDALAATSAGWYCVKLDVKSGFYHIGLSERSRRLTGFSVRWRDGRVRHFRFSRLVMGSRVSPWIFSLLTATILSILRDMGFANVSLVFVDDFLLFAPTKAEAEAALKALKELLTQLNIVFAEDKTSTEGVPKEVLLGLLCDLHAQTLALPPARLVRLLARAGALELVAAKGAPFPAHVLASVAGGVCNLGRVDPCVPSGTRALASYFFGQGGRAGWARFRASSLLATPAQREALQWLRQWAEQGFLQATAFLPDGQQRPVIDYTTDASGSNALGVATQAARLRVLVPDCGTLGIPTLEQLGRMAFLQEYGFLAPGFEFRHCCDSMPVCFREIKGSAREGVDNDLCALAAVAMRHLAQSSSTLFGSRYINGLSDRLSAESVRALVERGYLREGEAVEVTYQGLPPAFLAPLKARAQGSLSWRSMEEWQRVTKRE